ncbi:hypothetical protein KIN20_012973 [Parelaphostrongylus tenuis]|uniref:Uncharacterized protein n=1 Tax=Parelaphostrongylus tenuis TaxID=148309 RepID=A0AAD5N1K6_PARTN|nr:hypothetical protein KIN20_012973 [Parelaphostrongylus tenuis]
MNESCAHLNEEGTGAIIIRDLLPAIYKLPNLLETPFLGLQNTPNKPLQLDQMMQDMFH